MSPGAEAESGPAMNSAAQSPERANAATSGAMTWKYTLHKNAEKGDVVKHKSYKKQKIKETSMQNT